MHSKEQRRIISETYMFIFQNKFENPPYPDRITEKSGTSKKNQWDFQISKVGSLDFLDLKVNGSPVQPRKTRPCLTERLLIRCKELNQTNKQINIYWVLKFSFEIKFILTPSTSNLYQHHLKLIFTLAYIYSIYFSLN